MNEYRLYRRISAIAWPMLLANLSVPLVGLVDTAILGHQSDTRMLASVALGGSLLNILFWGFGFLRMGTTGAAAQAPDPFTQSEVLAQALVVALLLSLTLLIFRDLWVHAGLSLLGVGPQLLAFASEYTGLRLLSAPAVLCTYVFSGWLIGRERPRDALRIVLTVNIVNILLDWLFIMHWGMGVRGAALASIAAEWLGFSVALWIVRHELKLLLTQPALRAGLLRLKRYQAVMQSNLHLFLRTLLLMSVFAVVAAKGEDLGTDILAANAILLHLVAVAAYGLDAFAHAAETLVGQAVGKRDGLLLRAAITQTFRLSLLCAVAVTVLLLIFKQPLLHIMTNIPELRQLTTHYYPWVLALPLVSAFSYLFDGIFIGALRTKAMFLTMAFSALGVFMPLILLTPAMGNHGLWFAFFSFNAARGLSQAMIFHRIDRKDAWFPHREQSLNSGKKNPAGSKLS